MPFDMRCAGTLLKAKHPVIPRRKMSPLDELRQDIASRLLTRFVAISFS